MRPLHNVPYLKVTAKYRSYSMRKYSAFSTRYSKKYFQCDLHSSKMMSSATKFSLNTTLDSKFVSVNQKCAGTLSNDYSFAIDNNHIWEFKLWITCTDVTFSKGLSTRGMLIIGICARWSMCICSFSGCRPLKLFTTHTTYNFRKKIQLKQSHTPHDYDPFE